ncbi:MAG: glycosyltransferase family 9 protein [Paludibacteraceae bacterium]|nr:glycosyltransferase family 9 protein [Paludibacteraceae bacterium]
MKKLLIIRFSALGDVAMLAPVVCAAAKQNPEVQITVLSQQRMADLFADMPKNVVFHGVDLKQQSLREIVFGLGTFDAVADMHGVWRSRYISMAMLLRGAQVRTIQKGRFARFLLTCGMWHRPLKHMSLRYSNVLNGLGLTRIALDAPSMRAGKGIGIAPFAAHEGKIYPIERMERVVELLSKRGERIVLFGGGEKEQTVLDSWAKKYNGVETIAGKKSLREELDVIRGLRVMVSMDSANMHLASLVGTRVISIWGATHPNAGFLGSGQNEGDCIQRELKCRPCSIYGNRKCKFGDYRCMDIAPEEIVAKVMEEK